MIVLELVGKLLYIAVNKYLYARKSQQNTLHRCCAS